MMTAYRLSLALSLVTCWVMQIDARPASGASPDPITVQALEQKVQTLEQELKQLKGTVATMEQTTLPAINDALERLVERLEGHESTTAQVQQEILDRLGTIAEQDSSGSYVPSILGNMEKSSTFRQKIMKSIQGKLAIDNRTGTWQTLHVNGTPWVFPPGASDISISYGVITTHLLPYEGRKEWVESNWTMKDGEHRLEIAIGYPSAVPAQVMR